MLRLLNLVPEVQALLEDSKIEMGHARALLSADQNKQLQLANEVIKKSLSVRQTEALVGSKKTPTPTKVNQTKDPNTKKLERDLSEALGAEVAIKHNKKGQGVLSISFENLDALDGLLAKIKVKNLKFMLDYESLNSIIAAPNENQMASKELNSTDFIQHHLQNLTFGECSDGKWRFADQQLARLIQSTNQKQTIHVM